MRGLASFIVGRVSKEMKIHACIRSLSYMHVHESSSRPHSTAAAEKVAPDVGLDVTVLSREMIKPSSPTPHHCKRVQFSLLDQLASSHHTPVLLFYQNETKQHPTKDSILQKSKVLKNSLSEILVDYYPLAGRIQGNAFVDCNDEGVEFCEAHVSDYLEDVVNDPKPDELEMLLPFQAVPRYPSALLSVQVNHFSCGGTAIGVRISHKIADAAAIYDFLNAWANLARGEAHLNKLPLFVGSALFPPLEELNGMICSEDQAHIHKERIASKRIIFHKKHLNEFKRHQAEVSSSKNAFSGVKSSIPTKSPSRMELVSAFILKRMLEAGAAKPGFNNISTAAVPLNLRNKLVRQPIPEGSFGNFVWVQSTSPMNIAKTPSKKNNKGRPTACPELISEFRKTIHKMDVNHMRPLMRRGDRPVSEVNRMRGDLSHGPDKCIFTSMCSYAFYEVNFGAGKPIWVHLTPSAKNVVVMWSTRCGQGVEAWVHMLENDIAMLDLELDYQEDIDDSLSGLGYPMLEPLRSELLLE